MDGQYNNGDGLTVVCHQFITLSVDVSVQHGGREAPRRAGQSAAAEICSDMRADRHTDKQTRCSQYFVHLPEAK